MVTKPLNIKEKYWFTIISFRLRDKFVTSVTETAKRYVITNPPFDFSLLPTDQVSTAGHNYDLQQN